MNDVVKKIIRRIFTDWCCISIVTFFILLYKLYGVPHMRGFFCNDDSINHPFKQGTISSFVLYFVGFSFPIVVVFVTEYVHVKQWNSRRGLKDLFSGCNFPAWAWKSYKVISVFLFGAACSHLMTDIAKYEIGRLRPHFIDVCRPNINCSLPENKHHYIDNFKCLGVNKYALREMRLSFMSGHSSFSAYVMTFLAMYMHARWTWRGTKLILHVVQFGALMMAWFTALSRVSDHKHHWSDVLAGSLQGTLVAVITVVFISDLFPKANNNNVKTYGVQFSTLNQTAMMDIPCSPRTAEADDISMNENPPS